MRCCFEVWETHKAVGWAPARQVQARLVIVWYGADFRAWSVQSTTAMVRRGMARLVLYWSDSGEVGCAKAPTLGVLWYR